MKILVAHNEYRQRGGEDAAVDAEGALLRAHGHEVVEYRRSNHELDGVSAGTAALETLWSARTAREVAALLARERPQLMHVHNTWLRISPSLLAAAADARVPVVQTVHNMRLLCPQGAFERAGRVCEDCAGHMPWRAVVHACYRGSRAQSLVLVAALQGHRLLGTWPRGVARWIALSAWSREKLVQAALPAARIDVLPNFARAVEVDPGEPRHGLLFAGRLAREKGVAVLAQALRQAPELRVDLIGEGPQAGVFDGLPNARRLGWLPHEQVQRAMAAARALVLPSVGHENSPLALVEAMACALPAIVSDHGALAENVLHGHDGWCVPPGDATALAAAMREAAADPAEAARRGARALERHRRLHSPAAHHDALLAIYRSALGASDR